MPVERDILGLAEAANYIHRHPRTLQVYDRTGVLPAHRTSTGRRFWFKDELDAFLGLKRGTSDAEPGLREP